MLLRHIDNPSITKEFNDSHAKVILGLANSKWEKVPEPVKEETDENIGDDGAKKVNRRSRKQKPNTGS